MPITGIEHHLTEDDLAKALRADVLDGLRATPKSLPPKWFYDERGSELFERITELPEYYPSRAERAILRTHADEIVAAGPAGTLVELGAGSADKTRLLLDAGTCAGTLGRYVPVDVSGDFLLSAARGIAAAYPRLDVHPVVADFGRHLDLLPTGDRRLIAFLGGTIGNLTPRERATFLAELAAGMRPGDALLLGTDLVKDPARLVHAYDDAAGVTAEFNRNVLRVLDRELAADFDPAAFDHVAVWDAEHAWIEMRLRARHPMRAHLAAVDLTVDFAAGEELRTEISAKFDRAGLTAELAAAGLTPDRWWTDPDGDFALSLSTVPPGGV